MILTHNLYHINIFFIYYVYALCFIFLYFMVVAVVGSRGFRNYAFLEDMLRSFPISRIVSGGAKGADSMAEKYAQERSKPVVIYRPEYSKYGKNAPLVRNKAIIDASDICVAFWDGKSRGTKHAISMAKKAGKELHIFPF
jgi:hypothetical protein